MALIVVGWSTAVSAACKQMLRWSIEDRCQNCLDYNSNDLHEVTRPVDRCSTCKAKHTALNRNWQLEAVRVYSSVTTDQDTAHTYVGTVKLETMVGVAFGMAVEADLPEVLVRSAANLLTLVMQSHFLGGTKINAFQRPCDLGFPQRLRC